MIFCHLVKKIKKKKRKSKEMGVSFSPEGFRQPQKLMQNLENSKATQKR